MTNLVDHATRELDHIHEDQSIKDGILKVVQVFSEMDQKEGFSGAAAQIVIGMVNDLLRFKNLGPLTDDEEEWMFITEDRWGQTGGVWQNRRNGEAFSNDGGKTYYLLSEGGNDRNRHPLHQSWPESCWRFHGYNECKPGENHPSAKES